MDTGSAQKIPRICQASVFFAPNIDDREAFECRESVQLDTTMKILEVIFLPLVFVAGLVAGTIRLIIEMVVVAVSGVFLFIGTLFRGK